jgi:hypothetical protein
LGRAARTHRPILSGPDPSIPLCKGVPRVSWRLRGTAEMAFELSASCVAIGVGNRSIVLCRPGRTR